MINRQELVGQVRPILVFLAKLLGLVLIWVLAYRYLMYPYHIPDKWLTQSIAEGARLVGNLILRPEPLFDPVVFDEKSQIAFLVQNGKTVFGIGDICNGLDLMAIYSGLLILLPGRVSRKWKYVITGFVMIYLFDVVRAVALYYIYYNYLDYFLFNHKYVFTIAMYVVIFIGWLLYTRKSSLYG